MATSGGQPGNQNAKLGGMWRSSIKRALARFSDSEAAPGTARAGLDKIADELVKAAAKGDAWAHREIGERMDGKAKQFVTTELRGPSLSVTFGAKESDL